MSIESWRTGGDIPEHIRLGIQQVLPGVRAVQAVPDDTAWGAPFGKEQVFGVWVETRSLVDLQRKLLNLLDFCSGADEIEELFIVGYEVCLVQYPVANKIFPGVS